MQDDAILLVMDIYRANSSESKISEIESILGRLQAIELSFQLAFDLRQINSAALADAFDAIADLGRQAGDWLRYAKKRTIAGAECSHPND